MFQINGDGLVPICRCDFGDLVAGVVPGVVYQNIDGMKSVQNGLYRALYFGSVGQVAVVVDRGSRAVRRQLLSKFLGGLILNVQKCYLRILHGESFDDGLAYSGGTTGHDDHAIAKAWIRGKSVSFFHRATALAD